MTEAPPPPPPPPSSTESMVDISLRSPLAPILKLQEVMPELVSQYKIYEDAFVKKVKDGLINAQEHPALAGGIAVASGLLLMRGPRRFLLRHTLGRFQSEEIALPRDLIEGEISVFNSLANLRLEPQGERRRRLKRRREKAARIVKTEASLKELGQSVDKLKKESKNMILRVGFGEEELRRGHTKISNAGHEIQRLTKSIYKIESQASGLMDGLREIPGRSALKLRAEVASMAADLKQQRCEFDKRIMKIAELLVRV